MSIVKRHLILFTADYPFKTGETFLETEIGYLCDAFETVEIISSNTTDNQTREVPANCIVKRIDLNYSFLLRLKSLLGIFSNVFRMERKVIRHIYKMSLSGGVIKTALISLTRGQKVADHILTTYSTDLDQTVFYSYWCDDAALGIALAHQQNNAVKGICRIHRWDVYFEESAVNYLPYRHFISENLQKIFSISQDGIKYAVDRWKVDQSRFELSRLGIKNAHGPIEPKNDGIFRIVSCSNIIPVKRVGLIAEALKEISDHKIVWTHIGDGPLRLELEEKIKVLPENISVKLVGRLPNKEVYKLYETICPDLFVNVSSSEGVPVSIMEAMSYGIPVIATDVGGNGEIVNEENGILLPIDISTGQLFIEINSLVESEITRVKAYEAFKTWFEGFKATDNYNRFIESLFSLQSNESA